jgi:hypothetical protein
MSAREQVVFIHESPRRRLLGNSTLVRSGLLILLLALLPRRRNLRAQYYGDVCWLHSLIYYLRKIFAQLLQIGLVPEPATKHF